MRFPSLDDPDDTGWHVDASFPREDSRPDDYLSWRVNVLSRGRALLMLFLFSDVSELDAPTRIAIGSHLEVARVLEYESWLPEDLFFRKGIGGPWAHQVHLMEPSNPRSEGFVVFRDYLRSHPVIAAAYGNLKKALALVFNENIAASRNAKSLAALGCVQGMNRTREITDNAHRESFFHSLQSDAVHGIRFAQEAELRTLLRRYMPYNIEGRSRAPGFASLSRRRLS